jgi:hypothetical protein
MKSAGAVRPFVIPDIRKIIQKIGANNRRLFPILFVNIIGIVRVSDAVETASEWVESCNRFPTNFQRLLGIRLRMKERVFHSKCSEDLCN